MAGNHVLEGTVMSLGCIEITLRVGDAVNLEADVLAKYVERILEARRPAAASAVTIERLVEEGF